MLFTHHVGFEVASPVMKYGILPSPCQTVRPKATDLPVGQPLALFISPFPRAHSPAGALKLFHHAS